jgi:hypothetical protein
MKCVLAWYLLWVAWLMTINSFSSDNDRNSFGKNDTNEHRVERIWHFQLRKISQTNHIWLPRSCLWEVPFDCDTQFALPCTKGVHEFMIFPMTFDSELVKDSSWTLVFSQLISLRQSLPIQFLLPESVSLHFTLNSPFHVKDQQTRIFCFFPDPPDQQQIALFTSGYTFPIVHLGNFVISRVIDESFIRVLEIPFAGFNIDSIFWSGCWMMRSIGSFMHTISHWIWEGDFPLFRIGPLIGPINNWAFPLIFPPIVLFIHFPVTIYFLQVNLIGNQSGPILSMTIRLSSALLSFWT